MKYMGGKAKLAKEILPIILKDRQLNQYYVEPFCGGCNMIDKVKGNRIANDIHSYLIPMWKQLVNDNWIPDKINKEEYNHIRDNKHSYPNWLVGWVGFNCSYGGKYFGGFAGETKTKLGIVRDYQQEAINNVLKQIDNLKCVEFKNNSYNTLLIPDNSIVYCDPPYANTTKYSDSFSHMHFWAWIRYISEKHTVYVSEYSAPADFECIWSKEVKSSLSANGKIGGSKSSVEKLFTLKK